MALTPMFIAAFLSVYPPQMPILVHAQGIVESGLNPNAIGKAKEKGAWQVMEKYHGKVPKDLAGQMGQHIRIMSQLHKSSKGNIEIAVSRYNGKGKKAQHYLAKVRKKAFELHVIGI